MPFLYTTREVKLIQACCMPTRSVQHIHVHRKNLEMDSPLVCSVSLNNEWKQSLNRHFHLGKSFHSYRSHYTAAATVIGSKVAISGAGTSSTAELLQMKRLMLHTDGMLQTTSPFTVLYFFFSQVAVSSNPSSNILRWGKSLFRVFLVVCLLFN